MMLFDKYYRLNSERIVLPKMYNAIAPTISFCNYTINDIFSDGDIKETHKNLSLNEGGGAFTVLKFKTTNKQLGSILLNTISTNQEEILTLVNDIKKHLKKEIIKDVIE